MQRNPCRGWRDGDPVTYIGGDGSIVMLGTVVIRRATTTGRPYGKVQITSGGRIGMWVWPEGWVIGEGARQGTCAECGQAFRTDEETAACLSCNRGQDEGEGLRIRNLKAYYSLPHSGGRTPVKPSQQQLEEFAVLKAKDQEESPY